MSCTMSSGMASVSATMPSAGTRRSRTKRRTLSSRPFITSVSRIMGCVSSGAFEQCRHALAATDAHRLEAVAAAAALQLVQHRRQDAHAGGGDRMAERDARAVDVQALRVVPLPTLQ